MLETAWRPFRHACENFHRNKGALDCAGGKYNTWGGNPGLQRIIEDGMYNLSSQPPGSPTPPIPPGPPPPSSYSDLGPGFCAGSSGRPQTFVCDTTGAKPGCPNSQSGCAALCTADAACTGYMTQTMGKDPSTCNFVTSAKPSGSGTWDIQQAGKGLTIAGKYQETRDHCCKKGGTATAE